MPFKKELRLRTFKAMEKHAWTYGGFSTVDELRILLVAAFPTFPAYIIDEFLAQRKSNV